MRITFKHMDKSLSVKIFLPRFGDRGISKPNTAKIAKLPRNSASRRNRFFLRCHPGTVGST